MNVTLVAWSVICIAGLLLSVRSAVVVRSGSPLTLAGWSASAAYFAIALADALRHAPAPFHVDYAALAVLVVAFAGAGVRDERQAEPWWWPTHPGRTGAERRAER